MAYIGNNIQTQGFTPAVDYFSGNGSTVTFTLSRPVAAAVQVEAVIDNVIQNPSSAYTVSGNAITFTSAPLSGTNNIWVEYTSLITTYAAISQSPSVIGDITASGGYLSTGSFNNSFVDGTIVDYVTGNGRITVGSADGFTIYNGGTSARSALASWTQTGALTLPADATINGLTVGKGGGAVSTNTTIGSGALANGSNTGGGTMAFGYNALASNTTGAANSAFGYVALNANTTGQTNTGIGYASLNVNTTGSSNTGIGYQALVANTTASYNTAVGYQAGYSNTTGTWNTFFGSQAGYSITTGNANTLIGQYVGEALTTGSGNTFVGQRSDGYGAGYQVTTGAKNVILGGFIGNASGLDIRTASNYIVLSDGDGNPRGWWDNSGAFINGSTSIGGGNSFNIYNQSATGYGISCLVNNNSSSPYRYFEGYSLSAAAQRIAIYTNGDVKNTNNSYGALSDVKLKQDIVDASSQWNDIKNIKVRKYHLKAEPNAPLQIGVIAQEIEQISAGLVEEHQDEIRDEKGQVTGLADTSTKSVKYSILYMKAIKALQEAMERIETLEAKVTALEAKLEAK